MSEPTTPDLPQPAEALTIRPGQTLVLRYDQLITVAAEGEAIISKLAERLPGINVVVISGCQQMAVYDPDDSEEAK